MNRQKAVDPVSELFSRINIKSSKNKFRKEISLLFIVGCIGCIGTMFIFNFFSWNNSSSSTDSSSITITNQWISDTQKSTFLEILGENIIGEEIQFIIPNYNANAIYKIDFGDGEIVEFNSSSFTHNYSEAGAFPLKMTVQYRNQFNTIFEKIIVIESTSESEITSL